MCYIELMLVILTNIMSEEHNALSPPIEEVNPSMDVDDDEEESDEEEELVVIYPPFRDLREYIAQQVASFVSASPVTPPGSPQPVINAYVDV